MRDETTGKKTTRGLAKTCEQLRDKHEKVCQGVQFAPAEKMPKPKENILQFKKFGHLFKSEVPGYADFESGLEECYEHVGEKTVSYQKHVALPFL